MGPIMWHNGTQQIQEKRANIDPATTDDVLRRDNLQIIAPYDSMTRWQVTKGIYPKLLSMAAFTQYANFNTKLARDSIQINSKFLKFKHLPSLRREFGDGYAWYKLMWLVSDFG